jgi:hypothetical protein
VDSRPTVPATALNETVERVIVFRPSGALLEIKPEQLRVLDLGGLAIEWTDDESKIHRCVGLPLEVISVENRILKPV